MSPKTAACTICGRPLTPQHRPFCSPRCQQVDLVRWLNGGYRIDQTDPDSPPAIVPHDDDIAP